MNRLPANYIDIVSRLKEQIRHTRLKAAHQVNKVLLQLYWEIGATIIQMQKAEGWGAKVIDRLSADLRSEFPEFKGLSSRNLKYMSAYAKMFPEFGQQAAALLPWGHIQVLLDKSTDPRQFEFSDNEQCMMRIKEEMK
jgi:predicted nuclease of restriction endonuclease-like (RecB) superfamily